MADELQGWTFEGEKGGAASKPPAPIEKPNAGDLAGWSFEGEGKLADRLSPAQPPAEPEPRLFVGPIKPPPPEKENPFVGPRPPDQYGQELPRLPGVPIFGANVQKVPLFDEPQSGPPEINAKTGLPRQEPGYGAVPILDAPIRGSQRIVQGSLGLRDAFRLSAESGAYAQGDEGKPYDPKKADAMKEQARRQAAEGLGGVLSGALELYSPALVSHIAMAPVETALHLGAGVAGQQVTEKTLTAAGVPQEYAGLAGDLVLLTGVYGGVQRAKAKVDSVLGEHNAVAERLLAKERSGGQVAELTDDIFRGESYPVKIGEQKVTVEYQGASRTNGRGFWRVVDESGKPLHAGTGEDVQGWLRTQGAVPQAGEAAPETPAAERITARNPETARLVEQARPEPGGTPERTVEPKTSENEQAIRDTVDEAKQRLEDIRAMQEHLSSGQDVEMGQMTMEHTTPEERRSMLADNVRAHRQIYDELWEQLGKDIGTEHAAQLKAAVEQPQDVGESRPPQAQQVVGEPRPFPTAQTATPQTAGVPFETPQQQDKPNQGLNENAPASLSTIHQTLEAPPVVEPAGRPTAEIDADIAKFTQAYRNPGPEGYQYIDRKPWTQTAIFRKIMDLEEERRSQRQDQQESGPASSTTTTQARSTPEETNPPELAGWKFEGEPTAVSNGHTPIAAGAEEFAAGKPTIPAAPKAAKPAEAPKHEFSSTQTNLPEHVAEPMRQFARAIPDAQLASDGRESEPHIKYGLHDEDPTAVQNLLKDEPPITATLGKASLFSNDDADVLKVDIDSPDLHRLNAKIAKALPHTDTHPDYTPHATIAYLKPGEGKKYDGKEIPGVTGQKVTLPSVTFSGKNGDKVEIPLKPASNDTTKIQAGLKQPPKAAAEKIADNQKRIRQIEASAALRKSAEGMDAQIEEKRNPAIANQNVTARRANIAAGMAQEGDRLAEVQAKLKGLADAHAAGDVPETLKNIRSRAAVEDLMTGREQFPHPFIHNTYIRDLEKLRGKPGTKAALDMLARRGSGADGGARLYGQDDIDLASSLFDKAEKAGLSSAKYGKQELARAKRLYAAGITPENWTQAKDALKSLGKQKPAANPVERQVKEAERALIGRKIPGYFPTPKTVVSQMLDAADIQPGMSVLEPSAGKGNIADAVREQQPKADLFTIEYQSELRKILDLKGHRPAGDDFLGHQGKQYDRIVMNPPFENGQDVEHVQHAYDLLKPGGRLVSIMGEHPFFANDKQSQAFRQWLEERDGTSEKVDAGAFLKSERPTAANSRMVVIEKPKVPAVPKTSDEANTPGVESSHGEARSRNELSGERAEVRQSPGSGDRGGQGAGTLIRIPGENRHLEAHYAIRELGAVKPSHNPFNLQPNPSYAYKNDRNYSDPRNAERIVKQTSEFDPGYLITESPDAVNGAPVVDRDGNVLGGNSRTMTVARVYKQGKGEAYKDLLTKKAAQFGLNPEDVRAMKQPVLVREVSRELTAEEAQSAITDLNKTGTAALTSSERALADSHKISLETLQQLAGMIESQGPDGTLAKALDGKAGAYVVDRLVKDGVLTTQEKPTLFDQSGNLTPAAKDRISKLMLGKVFQDSEQFERTPPALRNKLERIVAPLSRLSGKPEWDLLPEVRQAIDILEQARATGTKNLDDLVAQQGLFGTAPEFEPRAIALAKALNSMGPVKLAQAFTRYANDSRGPTMFGEPKPAEAFAEAFGPESDQKIARGLKQPFGSERGSLSGREAGPHGPIYREFRHDAAGAIEQLQRRKTGEAIAALTHPDVGDIDLIWGNAGETRAKGYGLAKIEKWHPEVLDDLQGHLSRMRIVSKNENSIQLENAPYHAVIRRNWKGSPKTWLLTEYEKEPSAERTMDVPGTHATGRQTPPPGGPDSNIAPGAGEVKPKKPFGSERGSFSLRPKVSPGEKLRRAIENEGEESSSKEGPGLWVNPSGQSVMLHGDGGKIATHGTTAMKMTGKKTATDATSDLFGQGYIRLRSNSIEFGKSAGPRAILAAVKTAKEHAEEIGQTFIMVRGHVPQPMNAVVGFNEIGRFASNPVGFLTKQGQRGSVPAQALTAPVAKLAEGIEAVKQYGDEILKLLAPAAREGAEPAAMSVRHRAAELARESARAEAALEAASKILLKLPEDERWAFYDRVERGEIEPDRKLEIIGRIMRALLDKSRKDVQDLGNGKLESFIENYLPHYYKDPEKARKMFADYFAKKPLEGSKSFLKRRKYETLADGMASGLEPISDNPVDMVLLKVREMQKYVMAHQVLKDLKKQGILKFVRASNKMPEGYSRIDDKIATVFGPPFVDIKVAGRPLSRHTGRPEGRTESGTVQPGPLPYVETTVTRRVPIAGTRIMGYYAAPEPAARLVNNYLSPGLREKSGLFRGFLALGNSMNQFQLGFSAFHLGFTSMDAATSGLALGIYQTAHGNPVTGLLNALKSPIELAGVPIGLAAKGLEKAGIKGAEKVASPFSTMLRGDSVLKEYYREGSQGGDLAAVVDAMLLAGGRARMDRFYLNETTKHMMEAFRTLRTTPGIGGKAGKLYSGTWRVPFAIAEQLSRPIMEYIVPRQKMGVFADMARYELKRLKDASPEEVQAALARAWDSVDNRMGQLVYDNLFWHKIFKDALMASIRSVGWNTGTIRELLGGAADIRKLAAKDGTHWKPDVTTRLSYIIALPFMAAFVGAILQYLYTGEHPRDLKDCFFPRTGRLDKNGQPERVSSPSYIKDVVHYTLEPVRTAQNKIHPLLTTIWEMLENKDYRNKPIRNAEDPVVQQLEEEFGFALKAYTPMAVKGSQQEKDRGASVGAQIPPFFGISPAPSVINRQPKTSAKPLRMKVPKR